MKKVIVTLSACLSLTACTQETVVVKQGAPAPNPPGEAAPAEGPDPTAPPAGTTDPPGTTTPTPTSSSTAPEDRCLDGQDMNAADVDVKSCPAVPNSPADGPVGKEGKEKISLGAWEIGTTANGDTYKYGSLSAATTNPRILTFDTGTVAVNPQNLECWAKGYYRLRKILQDPPAEYMALRKAGFQYRFFQFQTDLRNGPTGYKTISSFQDHLVKWVTVISAQGVCQQPTLAKFKEYSASELKRRGLPVPTGG
jgi:hypothetical protein